MEEKPVRSIRIRARATVKLEWEADLVEEPNEFIPLHPPLQSHGSGNPTVRERGCFGGCF